MPAVSETVLSGTSEMQGIYVLASLGAVLTVYDYVLVTRRV
jgi:hypothetical protein